MKYQLVKIKLTRVRIALVEISAVGRSKDLVLYINDPKSKRIVTLEDAEVLRHHFAAWNAGSYQICVQNDGKTETV